MALISETTTDIDTLKAQIKKLSTTSVQAKMQLHDLAEELPTAWESIPDAAEKTYEIFKQLTAKRAELKAMGA
jgi:hypothetical protein